MLGWFLELQTPFSIDILINSLNEISNNYVKIEELIIGGENNDWAIEEHEDLVFKD